MRRLFYAVVALQILFLLGEAGRAQLIILRSPVVTLKVVPVDPRSLFMGNYIDLSYDISRIDLRKVPSRGPISFHYWGTVYVGLVPGKPWASIKHVQASEPKPGDKTIYLRGSITTRRDNREIWVEYGLERYYIPETKQEAVNRMSWRPNTQMTVEVAVPESRRGIIRRVLVNGKPLGF